MPNYKLTDESTGKTYIIRGASSPDEARAELEAQLDSVEGQPSTGARELTPRAADRLEQYKDTPQIVPRPHAIPWQDEIVAGMATPFNMIRRNWTGEDEGEGWGESIANAFDEEHSVMEGQEDINREKWGGAQTAADIVGSLGIAGPARGAAGAILPRAPAASTFARRAAKTGAGGAGLGFAYGSDEGDNAAERLENGLWGGGAGALFGAGGQAIGEGAGALGTRVIGPILRTVRDPARQARDKMARAFGDDAQVTQQPKAGLTDEQTRFAQDAGYQVGNIDRGGPRITGMADSIHQRQPHQFADFVSEREDQFLPIWEEAIGSMRRSNDEALRLSGNRRAGQARVKPLYDEADRLSERASMWDGDFRSMAGSDIFQDAMKRASSISRDEAAIQGVGTVVRNPFKLVKNGDGTERVVFNEKLRELGMKPNLRYWDSVKKGLDEIVEEGTDPITNKMTPRANRAKRLRDRLLNKLDSEVPRYADARNAARVYLGEESAARAGAKLYSQAKTSGKRLDEMAMQMRRWDAGELAEAKEGFLAALHDDLITKSRTKSTGHVDLSLNFLKNEKSQRVARAILGEEDFNRLMMHQNIQRVMQYRNKAMTGNSKTLMRQLGDAALSPVGTSIGGGATAGLIDGSYGGMSVGALLGMMGRAGQRRLSNSLKDRLAPYLARSLQELDPRAMNEVIDALASEESVRGAMSLLTHPLRLSAGRLTPEREER